jgi:hypothetical protein
MNSNILPCGAEFTITQDAATGSFSLKITVVLKHFEVEVNHHGLSKEGLEYEIKRLRKVKDARRLVKI